VRGIDLLFQVTSYLPLLGVLTVFLPDFQKAARVSSLGPSPTLEA